MGITIKGITVPALLFKLDDSRTVRENLTELEEKLSSTFFSGSHAIIDYSNLDLSDEDRDAFEQLLRRYGTRFLGFNSQKGVASSRRKISGDIEERSLKIINKTLRSGQRVEHRGDIIIFGHVNPDAYVVASGNVIVMGTLRGIVHAGASGDETVTVMALKLVPQQLRIASFITRAPEGAGEPEYPEKAYVKDNQIIIEKI